MTALFFGLFGGIGLFLLGMMLMTDGIKSFAGDSLRSNLLRFTNRPSKAFVSGAVVTALVQSSSATTVTVIGFVSAGLMTFPQAVGVVFGASLGTTATGWIVSVLGLKVSVGFYALPLIGTGAFMRLLSRGRWRSLGLALAGFGLIFVGIETLQRSMEGLSGVFELSAIPSVGLWGHVAAMLIGLALTVILQSSSAAVATTLTALHTGSINFEQAASLVIGAAIGTTITGALAAIGGSVPAKRTALAHVLFNTATGVIAIVLLPLLLWGITWAQAHAGLDPGAVSLAAFHTLFIGLGVLCFLPFVQPFAHSIERLLPERGHAATRHLDQSVLSVPAVALEIVRRALVDVVADILSIVRSHLDRSPALDMDERRIDEVVHSMREIHAFFARIPPISEGEPLSDLRIRLVHASDHLLRMEEYLRPPESIRRIFSHARAASLIQQCLSIVDLADAGFKGAANGEWADDMRRLATELIAHCDVDRAALISDTAAGRIDPVIATQVLDAIRWVARVGNHLGRISHYLYRPSSDAPPRHETGYSESH